MRHIGRRITVNWGDRVVVIEQLIVKPLEIGLTDAFLEDIYDFDGERVIKYVGTPSEPVYGRTASDILCSAGAWITSEELRHRISL